MNDDNRQVALDLINYVRRQIAMGKLSFPATSNMNRLAPGQRTIPTFATLSKSLHVNCLSTVFCFHRAHSIMSMLASPITEKPSFSFKNMAPYISNVCARKKIE
ncbi:hypothetical protein KIN20_014675 [Parelaphostrongylus tenuis]|uniref:Uncharacterized protein n=1 Tax=Parelaphostrongylus tenuis TaxID=148309 RepID=A0AAD5QNJ9_PARTN|nr:hypothetical protein KIN20_014675 [Parelaphostrongylus tenuis]